VENLEGWCTEIAPPEPEYERSRNNVSVTSTKGSLRELRRWVERGMAEEESVRRRGKAMETTAGFQDDFISHGHAPSTRTGEMNDLPDKKD
jgi:hypothetical protein